MAHDTGPLFILSHLKLRVILSLVVLTLYLQSYESTSHSNCDMETNQRSNSYYSPVISWAAILASLPDRKKKRADLDLGMSHLYSWLSCLPWTWTALFRITSKMGTDNLPLHINAIRLLFLTHVTRTDLQDLKISQPWHMVFKTHLLLKCTVKWWQELPQFYVGIVIILLSYNYLQKYMAKLCSVYSFCLLI